MGTWVAVELVSACVASTGTGCVAIDVRMGMVVRAGKACEGLLLPDVELVCCNDSSIRLAILSRSTCKTQKEMRQNCRLSKLTRDKIVKCQNCQMLKLSNVKIVRCQKLSNVKIIKCQNYQISKLSNVKITKCQNC